MVIFYKFYLSNYANNIYDFIVSYDTIFKKQEKE